ncbi:universal stress protein [uncultured Maribacter sp.]|uniref:universal stress protein n=1 Tax=uncultured Maribacter sp. TaxID=431308 RepID=UPI0030D99EA5|tara:strand:- start:140 stop:961 length:822 start_codon:yes stop_codon:yes gene_type:complete
MKKNNYKIVIFTDLKESLSNTLKSTLSLAKMIKGEIGLFHVKKASDVVTKESQLSAIRSINNEYIDMDKKIKSIVQSFSKDFGVPITYSFAIGNLKNEIANYIDVHKPDIVVLGKKKSNVFNLVSDNLIQFVLNQHKGPVFLTDEKNVLELNNELSFGILNDKEQSSVNDFTEGLLSNSQKPLKSFKIVENSDALKTNQTTKKRKEVEFIFEKNDNSIRNLSNYITKSNISLLCVNRSNDKRSKNDSITPNISDVIDTLKVPLILMGQSNNTL